MEKGEEDTKDNTQTKANTAKFPSIFAASRYIGSREWNKMCIQNKQRKKDLKKTLQNLQTRLWLAGLELS